MCGIIGYVGENNAVPYLLKGLHKLEYRGYDSSGIALLKGNEIFLLKRQGKIDALESAVSPELFSFCGIGHTRWATHGKPSQKNAHPHLSRNGTFAIVHNGIIENADILRRTLINEGCSFISETDTEVISQLLERNYQGNIRECIAETLKALRGSYALAIIHKDYPRTIFCARKDSPLLIAQSSCGSFVFSDSIAVREHCDSYYCLDDFEMAEISDSGLYFFTQDGTPITKKPSAISDKGSDSEKSGFPHYMLKEIYEQPMALKTTLDSYITDGKIHFPNANISQQDIESTDRIYIVGCGSAYHAGVYGRYIIEEMTGISTCAEIASEFRYSKVPLNQKSLVIVISQSGETADSIAALKKARDCGAKTLSVVNVPGSTMTQLSDMLIYTMAGREIAVATTKAYLCQIAVMHLLSLFIGEKSGRISSDRYSMLLKQLQLSVLSVEKHLTLSEKASVVAKKLKDAEHIYFIGRNSDFALALEGSLKLKEISYIHCEAYPAGELKHGTISLIEKGTPVVAVCLREDIFPKTLSGIKEVKARGANIIALTKEKFEKYFDETDTLITISDSLSDNLTPLSGVVPLQLLSYHVAVMKGCEVDKPRNLAKSVTVE